MDVRKVSLLLISMVLFGVVVEFAVFGKLPSLSTNGELPRDFGHILTRQQPDPYLIEPKYKPRGPPIFFIQIEGNKELDAISSCAMFSAARWNPHRAVILLSNNVETIDSGGEYDVRIMQSIQDVLRHVKKRMQAIGRTVFIARYDMKKIFKRTPLYGWYARGHYRGGHETVNLADGMRLAVLVKYGGSYYDTDMISLAPIPDWFLKGTLGYQDHELNNAAMSFPRKAGFLKHAMLEFIRDFRSGNWGHQGPYLMSRVYKRLNASAYGKPWLMNVYLITLPVKTFYPIHYLGNSLNNMVQVPAIDNDPNCSFPDTVAIHFYKRALEWRNIHVWHPRSCFARIVQQQCPKLRFPMLEPEETMIASLLSFQGSAPGQPAQNTEKENEQRGQSNEEVAFSTATASEDTLKKDPNPSLEDTKTSAGQETSLASTSVTIELEKTASPFADFDATSSQEDQFPFHEQSNTRNEDGVIPSSVTGSADMEASSLAPELRPTQFTTIPDENPSYSESPADEASPVSHLPEMSSSHTSSPEAQREGEIGVLNLRDGNSSRLSTNDETATRDLDFQGSRESCNPLPPPPFRNEGDVLPYPAPPIFFIQINGDETLAPISVCALVSAAKWNPLRPVILLTDKVKKLGGGLPWKVIHTVGIDSAIETSHRRMADVSHTIIIAWLNISYVFEGTPLYTWYTTHQNKGFQDVNLADGLRLAVLFKYGGSYYDLDMISINPIPPSFLQGSLGYQNNIQLNNAAISFRKNATFLRDALDDFVARFKGHGWGHQGPHLMTRVFQKFNETHHDQPELLQDYVRTLPLEAFYPILYNSPLLVKMVNDSVDTIDVRTDFPKTVAIHMFRKMLTHNKIQQLNPYAYLARILTAECPGVKLPLSEPIEKPKIQVDEKIKALSNLTFCWDSVPLLEVKPVSPLPVFFVQTSDHTTLEPSSACSMVSAKKSNPSRPVIIVSNHLVREGLPSNWRIVIKKDVEEILELLNRELALPADQRAESNETLFVARCHYPKLFDRTPLYSWFMSGDYQGEWETIDLADAVALVLLYKYGGTYYDTDMISIAAIPEQFMQGSLAYETNSLNNAAMSFPRNAPFLKDVMVEYVRSFGKSRWERQGPHLVSRVYSAFRETHPNDNRAWENYALALEKYAYYPVSFNGNVLSRMVLATVKSIDPIHDFPATVAIHLYRKTLLNKNITSWNRWSYFGRLVTEACPQLDFVFHEPSPLFFIHPGGLDPLATCSLVSAAKQNPYRPVILVTDMIERLDKGTVPWPTVIQNSIRGALKLYQSKTFDRSQQSIFLVQANLTQIFSETPLYDWHLQRFEQGWQAASLTIALKLAVLWKFGGSCFDTDMISIDMLPDYDLQGALGLKSDGVLGGSAMAFPKTAPFLEDAMKNLQARLDSMESFSSLMTGVYERFKSAHANDVEIMKLYLAVLRTKVFYAVDLDIPDEFARMTNETVEERDRRCSFAGTMAIQVSRKALESSANGLWNAKSCAARILLEQCPGIRLPFLSTTR